MMKHMLRGDIPLENELQLVTVPSRLPVSNTILPSLSQELGVEINFLKIRTRCPSGNTISNSCFTEKESMTKRVLRSAPLTQGDAHLFNPCPTYMFMSTYYYS